jgi:hypothetical protein
LKALFDQGYNISYVLSLPILKPSPYIPLTYIEDVDLHTMFYMEAKDINILAQVNKYTYQLSQKQQLWHDKIINFVSLPNVVQFIEQINWKKLYQAYHLYDDNYYNICIRDPHIYCYKIIKDITPWLNKLNINIPFNHKNIDLSWNEITLYDEDFDHYLSVNTSSGLMILLYYDDSCIERY